MLLQNYLKYHNYLINIHLTTKYFLIITKLIICMYILYLKYVLLFLIHQYTNKNLKNIIIQYLISYYVERRYLELFVISNYNKFPLKLPLHLITSYSL